MFIDNSISCFLDDFYIY